MSYQMNTNWMDELDSKLKSLEELEAARAKEAWEKHVVSEGQLFSLISPVRNVFFLPLTRNTLTRTFRNIPSTYAQKSIYRRAALVFFVHVLLIYFLCIAIVHFHKVFHAVQFYFIFFQIP